MSKIRIDELDYIVMEGGGARGAAYIGAIRALEFELDNNIHLEVADGIGSRKPALLDFVRKNSSGNTQVNPQPSSPIDAQENSQVGIQENEDAGKKELKIKGIGGASAGGITTFALALGLNSDECNVVLDYEFSNFLDYGQKHVGKYRMISERGELGIGEDIKNRKTKSKELGSFKSFEFEFDKEETEVHSNYIKRGSRNLLVTGIIKVFVDGIVSNLKEVKLTGDMTENANLPSFVIRILDWLRSDNVFIKKIGIQKLVHWIIFHVFIRGKVVKIPFDLDIDTFSNILYDRGMFSGFKVREFFMDVVIYAATRETHFHRALIEHLLTTTNAELKNGIMDKMDFDSNAYNNKIKKIKSELLSYKNDFKIGFRNKCEIGKNDDLNVVLAFLSKLKFKELHDIIGVEFVICAANFTTGFPVYFHYNWTPDFRVMEAVAGAMSIPPAIKPLYSEADVVEMTKTDLNSLPDKIQLIIEKFNLQEFYYYEHAVKRALIQIMRDTEKVYIDINNTIDLSAFLEPLRKHVLKDYGKTPQDKIKIHAEMDAINWCIKLEEPLGDIKEVNYATFKYFYNAYYKGLYMDGGYRCNIPYNFFRDGDGDLKGVLAIKLDGSFPPDLLKEVHDCVKQYLDIEDLIIQKLGDSRLNRSVIARKIYQLLKPLKNTKVDLQEKVLSIFENYMTEELNGVLNKVEKRENKEAVALVNDEDKKELRKKLKAANQQAKLDKNNIEKLIIDSIVLYRATNAVPPWKVAKSLVTTVFEGYEYGSEKGQIRDIADHNHIIALYDYGVSVYDFDMKRVRPQMFLAQEKASIKTHDFFK